MVGRAVFIVAEVECTAIRQILQIQISLVVRPLPLHNVQGGLQIAQILFLQIIHLAPGLRIIKITRHMMLGVLQMRAAQTLIVIHVQQPPWERRVLPMLFHVTETASALALHPDI